MTTIEALKEVYTSLGGELTDVYDAIADGIAVSDYVLIPDVVSAISQKAGGQSGGSEVILEGEIGSGNTVTGEHINYADIKDYVDAGNIVILKLQKTTNTWLYFELSEYSSSRFDFFAMTEDNSGIYSHTVRITSSSKSYQYKKVTTA